MGRPIAVEDLLGAIPLAEVESIEVKRFGLGKRITVAVAGGEAPLEGNKGAAELAEALRRAKAGA